MTAVTSFSREQRHASTALAAALAASLSIGLVSAAHAAAPADPAPSVRVPYGDLDLASDAGSSALYARIVYAAHTVCLADQVDIRNLPAYTRERACEHRAIADAVRDVHSTKLAVLHEARGPQG